MGCMIMKTKLNLTIDEELVPRVKQYARQRGKSVSELVEEWLRETAGQSEALFSKKWRGAFRLDDKEESRYKRLKERYQL